MHNQSSEHVTLPQSATHMLINVVGLFSAILLFFSLRNIESYSNLQLALLCIAGYAVPIIALEWLCLKSYRNRSSGIDFSKQAQPNLQRCVVKYLGLVFTCLLILACYLLLDEYRGDFYTPYYATLYVAGPLLLALALPYFYLIDQYMFKPNDGYWHMGMLLFNWRHADMSEVRQHVLGWLVKAFFLPLMLIAFIEQMDYLRSFDLAQLLNSLSAWWGLALATLFAIDLLIATTGYICALRIFDAHIKTTEPTLLGWLVTLMCYQPFWGFISGHYLNYENGMQWENWFSANSPGYVVWGSAILLLLSIYVWASLAFGIRFSNLTNRGILTNGPYRWCKHPAYVSKNLSWWMISMPFMVVSTPSEAVRHSLLLLLLNLIYLLRAKTEERHLSQDPQYVQYALYMNEHGLFAWMSRWCPALKFKVHHAACHNAQSSA